MARLTERKNVTMPPDWWAAFIGAARRADLPLSSWLGEAAKAALAPSMRRKLTKRVGRGRPHAR